MNRDRRGELRKINYLAMELDGLYHKSALKMGITDSVSIVLYAIHDAGGQCLLSDIYRQSGISRQTVNSAIRRLEAEGFIFLAQHSGRAKMVAFTEKGTAFALETVAKLCDAEERAFDDWPDNEVDAYIGFMAKYVKCFGAQIEKMIVSKNTDDFSAGENT